jgi:hypothetical protein
MDEGLGKWVSTLLLAGIVLIALGLLQDRLQKKQKAAFIFLLTWIFSGWAGFALYRGDIYTHYFGFLFPAPFLLLGGAVQVLKNRSLTFPYYSALVLSAVLLLTNLGNSPIKYPPNRQLQRAEVVARKILAESGGEPLNLAVIGEVNYEDGYQYFLESWNAPFVELDPQRLKDTIAGQMFVVCELPRKKCDPKREPIPQVRRFGRSEVAGEWEIYGVTLYRLTHHE